MRGVLVRALEWRARWFSDPADRLQFLRRNAGMHRHGRRRGVQEYVRHVKPASIVILATAVLLLPAAWLWISSKHVTVAVANTRTSAWPKIAPSPPVRDVPEPAGQVWLVQTT